MACASRKDLAIPDIIRYTQPADEHADDFGSPADTPQGFFGARSFAPAIFANPEMYSKPGSKQPPGPKVQRPVELPGGGSPVMQETPSEATRQDFAQQVHNQWWTHHYADRAEASSEAGQSVPPTAAPPQQPGLLPLAAPQERSEVTPLWDTPLLPPRQPQQPPGAIGPVQRPSLSLQQPPQQPSAPPSRGQLALHPPQLFAAPLQSPVAQPPGAPGAALSAVAQVFAPPAEQVAPTVPVLGAASLVPPDSQPPGAAGARLSTAAQLFAPVPPAAQVALPMPARGADIAPPEALLGQLKLRGTGPAQRAPAHAILGRDARAPPNGSPAPRIVAPTDERRAPRAPTARAAGQLAAASAVSPTPGPSAGPLAAPGPTLADAQLAPAAGVIFGCTNATFEECFQRKVVGLPRKYIPLVQSIVPMRTLLFVFNYSDRQLHGVYLAASPGGENLIPAAFAEAARVVPAAFTDARLDASPAESPFPAQCMFEVVEETAPCPEAEFKHVLEYTVRQRFKFKLSAWQTRDLVGILCAHEAKLRARRLTVTVLDEAR